ncbi:3828_t:CDS:2 [Dentiscutata erythropus]|uniref:3828_t:CDS:1 n=1 Tax=Dentiscutata erythropus TaxID=1348616 RepID=A0A9N9NTQ7_9GLOM|nr:3828_t:CDS:2 [Dentiscutata erythropus]
MPTVIRPLSIIERLYIMRQNVLHYHNLVFVVKFRWDEFCNSNTDRNPHTSESTKPSLYPNIKNLNADSKRLISQILYPTLQTLLTKFPSLSISIRDSKSSNPLFLQLDEIYLTSLIKFVPLSSGNDLEKLIERQHDLKFNIEDETKPLWRIVVGVMNLQKSTERPEYDFCILFCWHHSIIDEISSLSLNHIFIKALNETLKRYKSNTSKLKKIPDSYTHAILPIQKSNQNSELIEQYNSKIADINPRNVVHFHNRVKLVSLTKEEVGKIKTIAKDQTFETFFPSYGNSIKTLTPIYLGTFTNPQIPWTDHMGNYITESIFKVTFPKASLFPFPTLSSPITTTNNSHKMNNTNFYFWNLCHKYQSQIISDTSKFNNRMGLWDLFSKDKILKQMINCQKKLVGDENISLDDPDSNDWKIMDIIFSQSMYLVGPSLIVNSISQGQKMNLCIVYRVGSVSEQSVDSFAEGILNCLRIIGEDGEIELDQEI